MTNLTAERLYALLPAVHRIRDADEGEPLRALIGALAEQFAALEENVEQLYDDQFIETCASWVAPYIGDLIGYRPLHGAAPKIASPRAEVANTIAYRRRKGTALMLEQLASDVTDWPARVVEWFELLTATQYMKHLRPHARATADLRDLTATFSVGGAFDRFARTPEMRRPAVGGRWNIPNVGIFLWRLLAMRLTAVPLVPDPADASGRRFRVNPLGADLRLFRRARTEDDISHLAEPANVPEPLSVRLMALAVRGALPDDDYGVGESVVLLRADGSPVPVAAIRICDLRDTVTGWNHENGLPPGTIGIDPERGRVLLVDAADGPLRATFHYGTPAAIGGGEYQRVPAGADLAPQTALADGDPLQPALDAVAGGGRLLIADSLTYAATPTFTVDDVTAPGAPGLEVVVAAANPARPLVASGGEVMLAIGARGRLVLDGLVIVGGALHLAAAADEEPRTLVLRDCTLVPGLSLDGDGSATAPGAPSLIVDHPFAQVVLERCITGPIRAVPEANVSLTDCIVDAGATAAIAYDGAGGPGASLTVDSSTIVGRVHARAIPRASNSLFFAQPADPPAPPVVVERRQEGCMRFSYVPAGSVTPRRHRCVPETAHPQAHPHFTSLRYGDPGYGQLRSGTDEAIRHGADDGGEMGVLHSLMQPQRETNLRIRLDEYLRFGLSAGVFYAS